MLNKKVSYFNSISETKVGGEITIREGLGWIKDGKYGTDIAALRYGSDGDNIKKSLPLIAFHGVFEGERLKNDFVEASGIIIIDIDDIEDDLKEVKEDIMTEGEHILSVLVSPSGTGLKVLYLVDPEIITTDNYKKIGKVVGKRFELYGKVDYLSITDCLIVSDDIDTIINVYAYPQIISLPEEHYEEYDLERVDESKQLWNDPEEFFETVLLPEIEAKSDNNYHFIQMSLFDLAKFGFKEPDHDLSFVISYSEDCHKKSEDNKKRYREASKIAQNIPQQRWPYKTVKDGTETANLDKYEAPELKLTKDFDGLIDYSNLFERIDSIISEGDRVGKEISLPNFAEVFRFKGHGILTLTGIPGYGKANPNSSKVYTPEGYKLMGDIRPGDEVLTIGGKSKVLNTFPQGIKDIYKITFNDGSIAKCTEDHLWACKNKGQRYKRKDWSIKELKQIKSNYVYKDGVLIYSIPVDIAHFESKPLSIHPYLLGVLIGDGYLNQSTPRLSNPLREMFDYIEPMIKDLGGYISKLRFDGGCYTGFICGVKSKINLLSELRRLNLNNNAYLKHIPEDYIYNSVENRMALLRGLMDTDGYMGKNGAISFSTSSDRMKDDFVRLIRSLGGTVGIYSRFPSYKKGDFKITSKHQNHTITIRLPNELGNPFFVDKFNRDRWKPRKKYQPTKKIKNIELDGKEEATCIIIEDKSHLYFTDDFVITHNTELSDQIILDLARLYGDETIITGFEQSPEEHLIKLSRKLIGTNITCPSYFNDKDNKKIIQKALSFITSKIHHIDIGKTGGNIDSILEVSERYIEQAEVLNRKINYLLIDPFNMLSIKSRSGGHEKIEEILRKLNHFSHQKNIMIILIAHPFKMQKDEKTGLYQIPDFYSDKGSSAFFEMSYHGMVVHRVNGVNGTEVLVRILKVKQNNLGKAGSDIHFNYEINSGRYIPIDSEGNELEGDHWDRDWIDKINY